MRRARLSALAAASLLALSVGACGGGDEGEENGTSSGQQQAAQQELAGSIAIDGSSTVQPFAEAAAELFNEENPGVRITVGGSGTGDGFEKFCKGETQISDASRPIEAEEEQGCEKGNITPQEVQVANDGIAVVTNKALPIKCMTTAQLKKLLGPKSKVQSYDELDPSFPSTPVSLFTPGPESGTFDFFTEEVLETDAEQRQKGVQTSADDNQLVTGVAGEQGGLGYFGFSFYEQNMDKLNDVQVNGGDGCVTPSLETIQSGEYKPLARPLYMYPSQQAMQKPEVKAFMDFTLQNHQRIAEAAKIVPMTQQQAQQSQQKLG